MSRPTLFWLVAATHAHAFGAQPEPYFESWPVIAEAENFTLSSANATNPGFKVTHWGQDHLYGATFSNTFASRKALLHSTKDSIGTATSGR